MSDQPASQYEPPAPILMERGILGRWSRLCRKELREILRDRRTMITLIAMPLIVYPLLALVFQRFLLASLANDHGTEYVIGFATQEDAIPLLQSLAHGQELLRATSLANSERLTRTDPPSPEPRIQPIKIRRSEAEALVADGSLSLAVLLSPTDSETSPDRKSYVNSDAHYRLIYRRGSPSSEAALHYLQECLEAVNDAKLGEQLRAARVRITVPVVTTASAVESGNATSFSLAALLPLILVLMTVTGAVYPAIDLTAGERERGTLETLVAAPIPRLGLLTAKYVAVLTVAILTAVVNLLGMTFTAWYTGLDAVLLGDVGLSLMVVLKVLALLVLFAAFFSAVLLALTSCARSFKEAQAYIIPLMLICLVPGIMCLLPGIQLGGLLAVTPLANIVLMARDLLEGSVNSAMAAVVVVSTAFYICGAIALAARIFGTDAILFGSATGWSGLIHPSRHRNAAVDISTALGSLALLYPFYFVLSGLLNRDIEQPLERRLLLGALITTLLFAGVPSLVVSVLRVNPRPALGLARPRLVTLGAAVLLGVSLWPFAFEIVQWQRETGLLTLDLEKLAHVQQLVQQIPQTSPWLLVIALGVVPGICEELFFRGFLLSSLRTAIAPGKAIVVSALLFGLFHVVSANGFAERFLPSTLMGLVLGWVCVRSASVVPGMLLHALHNSLLLLLIHYRHQFSTWGAEAVTGSHLPLSWLAVAGGAVLAGGLLLQLAAAHRSRESV